MEELSRSHIVSRGDKLGEMPNVDICGSFFFFFERKEVALLS